MKAIEDVVVIGAGAMGSLFAARMVEGGAQVTLVDTDTQRLDIIAQQGLLLSDDSGKRTIRLKTSKAQALDGKVDLIVLFTKGMHSRAAIEAVTHLKSTHPLALTLQNGIGNGELLAEAFGTDQVIIGTAMIPSDLEAPNRVISRGFASVSIGGMTAAAQKNSHAVAELLARSGFQPEIADDIEAAVWEKLAFNAALNAAAMISLSSNGQLNNTHGLAISQDVLEETSAIAQAKGIAFDRARIEKAIDLALTKHPSHEASMLQDRRRGRMTEIGSINGAIVAEGLRFGIATPVNRTLFSLVRLIEQNVG